MPGKISGKILSITARLANATGNVSKLFPGDLLTLADVMKKLSDAAVDRLKVGENEAEALARVKLCALQTWILTRCNTIKIEDLSRLMNHPEP